MKKRRKYEKKPQKHISRLKIFLIRMLTSALIFGTVFLIKTYYPSAAAYIENQIDYNTDLNVLSENARQFILKYTPKP